jgi:hypothetical protein
MAGKAVHNKINESFFILIKHIRSLITRI